MLIAISKSKYSKVLSTFLAFLIFFNNVIFPTKAMALTGGPSQQEFSSFDPAGSSEMVNLFTGDFSYNIPLMDVDGYPVNISYHAAPTMDQEASWVGLGWNVNAGAINRGMRGLPDDFNGDPIHRDLNIKDHKAWGVSIGYFGELVGAHISLGGSHGIGVTHSNYSGYGFELASSNTFGVSAGKNNQGTLTAGLGVKISSTDGTDIYPSIGLSAKLNGNSRTTSLGVNVGCAINSREGLKSIYGGYSISSGKKGDKAPAGENGSMVTNKGAGKGAGIGFGSSSSIPGSSQGIMPKMFANMKSSAFSYDIKLGVNTCVYGQGGYVNGYFSKNKLMDSQKDINYNAFGYLYASNSSDDALLDFNREKDGMVYPELPNMPITNFTYDMFSATAQGMNYAFRPYRNDVGALRDNATLDDSYAIGLGVELMFSSDINIGLNTNLLYADGNAGHWTSDNDFDAISNYKHSTLGSDYEAVYFKVAGENVDDDITYNGAISNANDEPVYVDLDKVSDTKYKATDKLVNKSGQVVVVSGNSISKNTNKRAKRNALVSYLTADEGAKFALNKKIQSYKPLSQTDFTSANFDNVILQTSLTGANTNPGEFVNTTTNIKPDDRDGTFCGNRTHHLSEMSVTQNDGSRYIYGIPLYERKQVDAMFTIGQSNIYNSSMSNGLVGYSGNDNTVSNSNEIDNYFEKRTINDYSHGFLLTSIISSDYVDRTGDGPSNDDYGDYTKFNYSNVADKNAPYKWRIPVNSNEAFFNQGLLADEKDNKGSYLYGEKDLWYTQSIETKNYVAFFVLNNTSSDARKDAFPVNGENGGMAGTNTSRFLKEIRLYAKKDLTHGGIAAANPIKIVHFDYDNSLCTGLPNSAGSVGKLTLKKIWFTYGNSQKGKLSPYIFEYADLDHNGTVDSDENPSYNPFEVDRWGTYKKNTSGANNNLDFPYCDQTDLPGTTKVNKHAAAWSLSQISTPAGSKIKVNYEADDYAFVQDKNAGQMIYVAGMGSSSSFSSSNNLYSADYIYVDLEKNVNGGVLAALSAPVQDQDFKNKFINNLPVVNGDRKMYFRFKIDMDGKGAYEFVPGYADVLDAGICPGSPNFSYNGQTYKKYGYIKIQTYGINDKNQDSPNINSIVKAGFQMGRMYLPQVVFPGSAPNATGVSAVQGLVTSIKDAKYLFKGINKALYARSISKSFALDASVVRLFNPDGFKKGGGHRVSQITINDGWNSMSSEADSDYGQMYDYTTKIDGVIKSSGVASYEPLQGGDENSMRTPIEFAVKKHLAPNDEYFQEEPIGESFFPDPLVGYSKVTIKNIPHANVTKHATGYTEYEFFTAKEFPVIADRTPLLKQRVKPNLLLNILKFGSTDKLYLSQGYLIKTNDMHGKMKSQKIFAEGSTSPISGIIYHYKSTNGPRALMLDNEVDVLDKTTNTISHKNMGKTTDFYTDSRNAENDTYTTGVSVNIQSATCTYYVPLVFVWPSFGYEHREFKSIGTTKLIQQYGLVDYVEAFENGSTVKTENLLYDDLTGEVLLTKTNNDFDAPVYNLKYPAYYAYEDMGAAFRNTGITFNASIVNSSGKITSTAFFRPGDEVGLFENSTGTYTKAWVIDDKVSNSGLYLVDVNGNAVTIANSPANFVEILRSGRRNMQSAPMASLLSLENPINSNGINLTNNAKVLNSSAVEYSDNWHLLVGDNNQTVETGSCSCIANSKAQEIFNLTSAMLNTVPFRPYTNVNSPFLPQGYVFGLNPPTCPISPWWQQALMFSGTSNTQIIENFISSNGLTVNLACYQAPGVNVPALFNYAEGGVLPAANSNRLTYLFGQFELNNCGLTLKLPVGYSWLNYSFVGINNFSVYNDCSRKKDFKADIILRNNLNNSLISLPNIECSNSCYDLCTETYVPLNSPTYVQCGKIVGDIINPYVENIRGNWRVKKSYSYLTDRVQANQANPSMNGDISQDGTFASFMPFWKYNSANSNWQPIYAYNGNSFDKWTKNNEVNKINEYGNVLQAKDVLGRPSASLYGYNHTLPVASANNAYYNQLAFDGFEDYDFIRKECSASLLGTTGTLNPNGYIEHFNYYIHSNKLSVTESHSGRHSIKVAANTSLSVSRKLTNPNPTGTPDDVLYHIKPIDNYGLFGPFYSSGSPYPDQKFVLSVWAKENIVTPVNSTVPVLTYPNTGVSVSLNGVAVNPLNLKKSAIINGWQKLEFAFVVPAGTLNSYGSNPYGSIAIALNSGSNDVYYDDIRIHPFNSSMKSMVYDPQTLRLMAELDDRNYATFYEYDEEGTLVRVKKETEKGIFTIKESRSGLKK